MERLNVPAKWVKWIEVDPSEDGCWIWSGKFHNGVPTAYAADKKRDVSVRRYLFERINGPVGKGKRVTQTCDDPRCVWDHHAEALTMRTMLKCAAKKVRYDAHWKAKQLLARRQSTGVVLTLKHARVIRERMDRESRPAIATDLGVSLSTVDKVVQNKTWREAPRSMLGALVQQVIA